MSLITLLTDFGTRDPFVGVMKGVIAGIAPGVPVVDITHEVPPQDLRRAGVCWLQAVPYFPEGTVHVAVVDPGVGSSRAIIAARGRGAVFLAPDNGLLGYVLRADEIVEAVRVEERRYFLPSVSSTFHGRDIFAPVAARLASGLEVDALGPPAEEIRLEEVPRPVRTPAEGVGGATIAGEVLDIDRFGNVLTNIRLEAGDRVRNVRAGGVDLGATRGCYAEVPRGSALAIVGSSGFIEVAVREGRADRELGIDRGAPVTAVLE